MADSKPVKLEVNGTVILPPLLFPGLGKKKFYLIDQKSIKSGPKNSHRSKVQKCVKKWKDVYDYCWPIANVFCKSNHNTK